MKRFKYIICMLLLLVATPIFFTACDSKELADLKTKVETLEEENHTLKTENTDLETRYTALQLVRIEQEDEIDELEEEIETLEAQRSAQTTLVNSLNAQIATLQESQNSLTSANTDLTSQLSAKTAELEEAEAELETTTTNLANKTAELTAKQNELNETKAELEEVKAELDALKTEHANLQTEKENLETANGNLTTENSTLTTENENLKTENENLEAENSSLKETTSEMIVYQNKTFASTASDDIEVTPVLEADKTYMFVNCTFNNGLISTAEGIDARFYNCTFGTDGEKGLYLTSFINLEVVGCTFGGELGDHFNSSANYGLDLDIYNTTVQNIIISYNNFEGLTTTSETKPCVAISIKVRLGENDNPTEEFWADKTEGTILGTVIIEANTFSNTNNSLYVGTNPKGEDTEANLSSGAYNAIVRNNNTDLNVYERYLYEKDAEPTAQLVEANATATFGNKTEAPAVPAE